MDQRIEDLLREARKAAKVDRERIELFEMLIKTPSWQAYLEILEAKIQMFADQVLAPSGGVDGAIVLEYVKGAMSGLIMARDIPTVTIAAKAQIGPMIAEDEDEPE